MTLHHHSPPPTSTTLTHKNSAIYQLLLTRLSLNFNGRHYLGPTFDGRWWPLMKNKVWWKTAFDIGQTLMKDDLWWKTTFDGRHLFTEDNFWWKTTLIEDILLKDDNHWWKTPLMEADLSWRTTFDNLDSGFPDYHVAKIFFAQT